MTIHNQPIPTSHFLYIHSQQLSLSVFTLLNYYQQSSLMAKKKSAKSSGSSNSSSSSTTTSSSSRPIGKTKRTRKSVPRESPPQRSSVYRGVTRCLLQFLINALFSISHITCPFYGYFRHRWTGRYEAHLWDKNCWNQSQSKKGRQGWLLSFFFFLFINLVFL